MPKELSNRTWPANRPMPDQWVWSRHALESERPEDDDPDFAAWAVAYQQLCQDAVVAAAKDFPREWVTHEFTIRILQGPVPVTMGSPMVMFRLAVMNKYGENMPHPDGEFVWSGPRFWVKPAEGIDIYDPVAAMRAQVEEAVKYHADRIGWRY